MGWACSVGAGQCLAFKAHSRLGMALFDERTDRCSSFFSSTDEFVPKYSASQNSHDPVVAKLQMIPKQQGRGANKGTRNAE